MYYNSFMRTRYKKTPHTAIYKVRYPSHGCVKLYRYLPTYMFESGDFIGDIFHLLVVLALQKLFREVVCCGNRTG